MCAEKSALSVEMVSSGAASNRTCTQEQAIAGPTLAHGASVEGCQKLITLSLTFPDILVIEYSVVHIVVYIAVYVTL